MEIKITMLNGKEITNTVPYKNLESLINAIGNTKWIRFDDDIAIMTSNIISIEPCQQ